MAANVALHHIPVDHETRDTTLVRRAITSNQRQKFDVIVIDGHLRREMISLARDYVAPDGAIIFDNSDYEEYGFYEETRHFDCKRIDFFGFAPGVSLQHCTSLLFFNDCFLLRPDIPIKAME